MAVKISKNRLDMGSTPIKNVSYLDVDQVATQAAPATGKTRFYSKTDGALYVVPAAGSETAVSAGVPANLIAHYNGTTAPSGWTEATAVRGRTIVGLPLSGTGAGTVGTALTNVEDRTHTHTGPSHTHTGPSHQHEMLSGYAGSQDWFHLREHYYGTGSANAAGYNIHALTNTNGWGTLTFTLDKASGTGATGAGGTDATGTAATSNVMPYIQYLAVIKS